MVLDHLPDAIVTVYDQDLRILALHGAALAERRLDPGAVIGSQLGDAAPGDAELLEPELHAALAGDERTFECEASQSGRRYEVSLVPYRDAGGTPIGVISVSRDVTERHQLEKQLRHLADHDALTGLPNRRRFTEELESHAARSLRYGPAGAVLLVDLDNFKQINDTLGHATGDKAITRAATVLRDTVRVSDVVARIGGDEFAILLPYAHANEAAETAGRIVAAMRPPSAEGQTTTVSVGVAAFADHPAGKPDVVVAAADQAMYHTKAMGRDGFSVFQPGQRPSSERAA
jgi:diguanylate cyclase (GGDEF)-like protein